MTELEISTNKQFKLMSQAVEENKAEVLTFSLTNLLEYEKQGDNLKEKEVRARRKRLDTSVLLSLQVGRDPVRRPEGEEIHSGGDPRLDRGGPGAGPARQKTHGPRGRRADCQVRHKDPGGGYRPLIGLDRFCDANTDLLLVESDHVT